MSGSVMRRRRVARERRRSHYLSGLLSRTLRTAMPRQHWRPFSQRTDSKLRLYREFRRRLLCRRIVSMFLVKSRMLMNCSVTANEQSSILNWHSKMDIHQANWMAIMKSLAFSLTQFFGDIANESEGL